MVRFHPVKGKKKRASCGAAAQTQASTAVASAMPLVASGSSPSTTEVPSAASAAVISVQKTSGCLRRLPLLRSVGCWTVIVPRFGRTVGGNFSPPLL